MARCTYKITRLYFDATLIPSVRVRQRYIIDIDVITIFRMELAESPRDPTCPNVSQRSPLMQTRNCTCRNSFARSFAPRFLVLIHRIALTLPHRRKFRKRVASVFCFAFLRRVDALRNVTTFVEYLKINRGEWRDILLVKNSNFRKKFQVRETSSLHGLLASRMPTYGCNFAENLCRPVCPFPSRANISTKDFVSRRMRVSSFTRPCSLFTTIFGIYVLPETGISHPPRVFSFKRFSDSFTYRYERPNEMLPLI